MTMLEKKERLAEPAFLIAQLGAHAAAHFAEKLEVLDLTPSDAGILRMLRVSAALSQQELGGRLSIHPSRLVAIIDSLEQRRLVERRPNPDDRRLYSLHLTSNGEEVLVRIGAVARQHQENLLSALNKEERETLGVLLTKVADQQGLTKGVHPGYQQMGAGRRKKAMSTESREPAKARDVGSPKQTK